jgi:hypothetical protein
VAAPYAGRRHTPERPLPPRHATARQRTYVYTCADAAWLMTPRHRQHGQQQQLQLYNSSNGHMRRSTVGPGGIDSGATTRRVPRSHEPVSGRLKSSSKSRRNNRERRSRIGPATLFSPYLGGGGEEEQGTVGCRGRDTCQNGTSSKRKSSTPAAAMSATAAFCD